jgi:phage shock protein PspC (stress-responsive transcriptional regulator)
MSDHETQQPAPDDGPHTAPPPPPPPTAARPLWRRDHHKHLAGVAGGIADYMDISASAVRVTFVILALFGIGIPVYIVGWLAMPSPSMPRSYVERWFGRSPSPAVLLAVAAVVVLLITVNDGPYHDHGPDWGFGWGLALLFGGWLLFRADSRTQGGGATTVLGPPAPDAGSSTWYGPGGAGAYAPPSPADTVTAPLPRPRRPRSMLGRFTLGVALASVGVAALLERVGAVSLEPQQYAALGLTIVGFGLIAGAWVGRAYGLIGAGVLLLPVVFFLGLGPLPLHGGAGDVQYAPETLEDLRDSYTLGAGELQLDLTALDLDGGTEAIRVAVGLGQTTIVVPDEVTVVADVTLKLGEVELFGRRFEGPPFPEPTTATFEGTSADAGRLELQIDNGVGEIVVRRETEER